MNRTRLLPLAVVMIAVAGCASHDDGSQQDSDSPPPPEEIAAGGAWNAQQDDDATNEPAADITTPGEPSDRYLDAPEPTPILDDEGVPIDPSELSETESCHRATGYRSGRAFTICITRIDGKPVEVNTARAYLKMRAAARRRGLYLHVVSGFRTMAQQRYLYDLYKSGRGNLAAPPGYSNHQSGHALDLDTSARGVYAFLASHGAAYRFHRTVPSEAWHWEHW